MADERRRGPERGPTRYGKNSGSGANEPKHNERKDARGFVSRQGGDQTGTQRPEEGSGDAGERRPGSDSEVER
jgi:hypothetical protein